MYKYFKHKDIDFVLWDECVLNSKNSTIYAFSWFLQIVCKEWDALIKVEVGKYKAVCPLPIKTKLIFKVLYTPVFCHQLGLFALEDITTIELLGLQEEIESQFKLISNYQFNISNSELLKRGGGFIYQNVYTTYHLNLNKSYEEIFNGLDKDRQRNIIKSRKLNARVEESDQLEKVVEFFKETVEKKIYGGVRKTQYRILKKLFLESRKRGYSKLYVAKNGEGKIISGCLLFFYKNLIIKFFNASNEEGRKRKSDSFLMDFFFKTFSGRNIFLDFERGSSLGVNSYKESYNPDKIEYVGWSSSNLSPLVNRVQKFRKLVIQMIK